MGEMREGREEGKREGEEPAEGEESHEQGPPRSVDSSAVISYLIGGVLLYGAAGWLLDRWLGTRGFVGAGIVFGAAAGVWVIWLRYGRD